MSDHAIHPKGRRTRVLLTSVFGPYAQDDEYGSRKINPMELYHNQVTRFQGVFSLRMFHRSFGLMLIQNNIEAPCTLLDFPDLDRFVSELQAHRYDVVGISGIIPNIGKVVKMCTLVRKYLPDASIVIGGHVTNKTDIQTLVDADHIVKGDGVAWFRRFLGQDPTAPIRHPLAYSGIGTRILGIQDRDRQGDTAAILVPSVGCPMGCNFCSTSALFGGKGRFTNFYDTGDALFKEMCRIAKKLNVQSFFVLDENFLLHRKRALRLLELMQAHDKSWALYVFSSARVLKSYTMAQLVGMGISWVWMGLEGSTSGYAKLKSVDTRALVRRLQSNGIRVLGSSIIGLEGHRPEEMDRIIDEAVGHATDFHQFMLYTPNPGTPLYEKHRTDGTLFKEVDFSPADAHGQYRFNYRHRHIRDGMEEQFLQSAFKRDFAVNGPSLARLIQTQLAGWQKYRRHPDLRIRRRYEWEARPMGTTYAAAVWAMRHWYRQDKLIFDKLDQLLKALYRFFGIRTRAFAPVAGRWIRMAMARDARRVEKGWSYEPPTFYEKNQAVLALEVVAGRDEKRAADPVGQAACNTQPA